MTETNAESLVEIIEFPRLSGPDAKSPSAAG